MKKRSQKITTSVTPIKIEKFVTTGQGIGTVTSDLHVYSHSNALSAIEVTSFLATNSFSVIKDTMFSTISASGMKVLLWNALPGEEVTEFLLTKQKNNFLEGIALSFNKLSPNRIAPKDTHFISNSPWQILSEEQEVIEKSKILTDLYSHLLQHYSYPKEQRTIPFNKSPKNYFYRNKMEYSLYYDHKTEKIQPAIHFRGSHQKIPIFSSSLELPEIWQHALNAIDELNQSKTDSRNFQSLLLRSNQQREVQGGLFENNKPHPVFPNLTDSILGQTYSYSPNGFFQINLPVYEQVLHKIKKFIQDSKKVIDLYAGVGTIGLSVASDKNLTLVEVNASAFQELSSNTQRIIDVTKNTFLTHLLAKSEDVTSLITHDATIIVDPPRAGCHHSLVQRLIEVKPQKIVYLSCNPITQVRDLSHLLPFYQIEDIEGYNFFPRTPHIETVVLLSKLNTNKHTGTEAKLDKLELTSVESIGNR